MNKQINVGSVARTFMGISMLALAMSSFAACGSNNSKNPGGTTTDANSSTGTGVSGTTTGATTGGNVIEPNGTPGGNTTGAGITGNSNGVAVNLAYALFTVDANATNASQQYALKFFDYNPYCFYAQNPDPTYSTYPNSFDAMSVYISNGGSAPTAGTYTLGTTGMAIDPNGGGFEQVTNCVAPSAALSAGSTVTLEAVDATAKTASGTVMMTLSNGATLSGSFTTVSSCPAGAPATPATTPLCTNSTITYK